jgi:biopolymer transport protein ExbD
VVQLVRKEEAVKTSRLVLLIIFITTTIVAAVKLSCALIAAQTSGPAIEFEEGTDLKIEVSECLSFIRDQVLRKV